MTQLNANGPLVVEVEEQELVWDGQPVYAYNASRDNLAFLLFRDGIRSVSFRPGLEPKELETFVSRLAHADDLESADYDLATALWEDDFAHIDYTLVDPFLEGEVLTEGAIDDLRGVVLTRLEEARSVTEPQAEQAQVNLEVVDLKATDLDTLEISADEAARGDMAAGLPTTTLEEFAVVLFELLGNYPWPIEEGDGLHRALVTVIGTYAKTGDLHQIDFLIERLKQSEVQGRCTPGFVGSVLTNSVTAESLNQLFLKTGQVSATDTAQIQHVLAQVRQWVLPALLELLTDTSDRAIRRGLLALLRSGDGVPATLLGPLMRDHRWFVVRNAVELATVSRDETVMEDLDRLTRHPEAQVRREVMRTLSTLGGPRAARFLARSLSDEDASVRVLAVSGLGRIGGPAHEAAVLAEINSRGFEARSPDEIGAFLNTYAALGGERAVPLLDRLWRSKLFDSHPRPVRVAALRALATIPGPLALSALREAVKSGGAQLEREAERALQEALARQQGSPR
ncbi:MAG: HEAT repeat domain-containing protein [Thermoleophilia bacterium]|nr:HEAT repeat domain-containing protein [Thermoleophilia bacterium]